MKKSVTPTELQELLADDKNVALLDVRRKDDFDKEPHTFRNAQWQNPLEINEWLPAVPTDREIVVYCVRGGSVSQSIQQQLADSGRKVRYVEGGLEALNYMKGS